MNVSAVIVAAGKGIRMGHTVNKVYLPIAGKPVLYYSLKTFDEIDWIKEIVAVVSKEEIEYCKENVIKRYFFKKPVKLVEGGSERQYSVYNGIINTERNCEIITIHDGARPLIEKEVVIKALKEAYLYKAVALGVPVKDTIKVVDEKNFILNTPDRKYLWAIQTPQVFERNLIIKAHQKALEDGFLGTDDTVLVERLGYKVKVVEGDYRNIKITTPEDLIVAEAFLKNNVL
ncbi:2-C-methyl-D-erythritol 4-phosphate cytidylyltransferase [Thermoanaerobacter sp. CM-CNRG TB177]|jgi:2-C-methyl-D-erythritol 4-phosphate cytidylyltransferase|uniref:2-C-methyl-D-erythritol 4-phosphate cytidylyltransferase n=1 Tax=Thermoanaerobacter sp. CM-CNRG TB177 TaxID=2800659 RepID=UPI001BDF4675|nr:2-C-methyl-D-erythritol 4-phosphate cytidylyltransferase [Thermoanaerobacter sp. CM-CNRG TB177]MBT1278557.1 2-C-methyl-D-erythritol 4-phosphate cytidylyltransferase [Thermoanaerobacter sp. CM-CNRG TB177]MDK2814496.1 2-C-methyl-D-erythritol 4-phosphate cytidylyltransferase [Thermoanaerobacter sp.]